MKKILALNVVAFLALCLYNTGVHEFSVPKIEGGSQALSVYNSKKILLVTLPIQESSWADSFLYSLDTLSVARSATLQVVGVPCYEDGYTSAQKQSLNEWYRSKLNTGILITEGLYTRKTSGSQQHGLFKYLTDETLNGVFNIDVSGPGYKFFCNTSGKLYGVLVPQTKIYGSSVQKTLNMQ